MKFRIMIDQGHGGGKAFNRSFVNVPGWPYCNEGDNNFIFGMDYLKPAFLEYENVEVDTTRKKISDNPTLVQRGQMAKGYDILISPHTNGFNGRAEGSEIWDSTNPKESIKELCDSILHEVTKAIGTVNRGTKYRTNSNGSNYYGVLRYGLAKRNFIIEYAFHDNYKDIIKFVNNMKAAAEATAKAIADYYGLKKKGGIEVKPPVNEVKPPVVEKNYYNYFEKNELMILETNPKNIYCQYIGGKTLNQIGAIGINGGFFDESASTSNSICSIMVNDGKVIGPNAYTNEYNRPNVKRGTMTLFEDGQVTVQYVNDINELHKPYIWSIGGLALYPTYDPVYEQAPSDWLRPTNHSGIAYANGKIHLIVSKNCDMRTFKERIVRAFGDRLVSAIAVDGGGSTQMFVPGGGMKSSVNRKIPSIIGIKKFP